MSNFWTTRYGRLKGYLDHSDFITVPLALLAIIWQLPLSSTHFDDLIGNLVACVFGTLVWTFVEYWVHRALHIRTLPRIRTLHLLARAGHMRHHQNPAEPPGGTLYSTAIVSMLVLTAFLQPVVASTLLGFLFGYLVFISLHHAEHHGVRLRGPMIERLAANHQVHHHAGPAKKFGVSSELWDWLFRTA